MSNCKFCPLLSSHSNEVSYELIVEAVMQIALNLSAKHNSERNKQEELMRELLNSKKKNGELHDFSESLQRQIIKLEDYLKSEQKHSKMIEERYRCAKLQIDSIRKTPFDQENTSFSIGSTNEMEDSRSDDTLCNVSSSTSTSCPKSPKSQVNAIKVGNVTSSSCEIAANKMDTATIVMSQIQEISDSESEPEVTGLSADTFKQTSRPPHTTASPTTVPSTSDETAVVKMELFTNSFDFDRSPQYPTSCNDFPRNHQSSHEDQSDKADDTDESASVTKTKSLLFTSTQSDSSTSLVDTYRSKVIDDRYRSLSYRTTEFEDRSRSINLSRSTKPENAGLHSLEHSPTRQQLKCQLCEKTFISVTGLKYHQLVHTGERPYECKVCNKKFAQKCNLKSHLFTHSGVKPFVCNICDKGFLRNDRLRKHRLNHHSLTYQSNTQSSSASSISLKPGTSGSQSHSNENVLSDSRPSSIS